MGATTPEHSDDICIQRVRDMLSTLTGSGLEQDRAALERVLELAGHAVLPDDHMLIRAEVEMVDDAPDHESCLPPASYACVRRMTIVSDTLGMRTAGMFALEAGSNDPFPDGVGELVLQVGERFEPQRAALEAWTAQRPLLGGLLDHPLAEVPRGPVSLLCPTCGNYPDTAMHEHGCSSAH